MPLAAALRTAASPCAGLTLSRSLCDAGFRTGNPHAISTARSDARSVEIVRRAIDRYVSGGEGGACDGATASDGLVEELRRRDAGGEFLLSGIMLGRVAAKGSSDEDDPLDGEARSGGAAGTVMERGSARGTEADVPARHLSALAAPSADDESSRTRSELAAMVVQPPVVLPQVNGVAPAVRVGADAAVDLSAASLTTSPTAADTRDFARDAAAEAPSEPFSLFDYEANPFGDWIECLLRSELLPSCTRFAALPSVVEVRNSTASSLFPSIETALKGSRLALLSAATASR